MSVEYFLLASEEARGRLNGHHTGCVRLVLHHCPLPNSFKRRLDIRALSVKRPQKVGDKLDVQGPRVLAFECGKVARHLVPTEQNEAPEEFLYVFLKISYFLNKLLLFLKMTRASRVLSR